MKLEITKEKVLEAASKCSQARETLKTLFPEAFAKDQIFPVFNDMRSEDGYRLMENDINGDRSRVWLGNEFNWEIKKEYGGYYLIPTKK